MDLNMLTSDLMAKTQEIVAPARRPNRNSLLRTKPKSFHKKNFKLDKLQSVDIEPEEKTEDEIDA